MTLTADHIKSWRDGAEGFLRFIKDVKPRIPSRRGGFEVFVPADFQVEAVHAALTRDEAGRFKFTTIAFSLPRRHSKTTINALLVLWRFLTRRGENIVVMANSERQTLSVGFSLVKKIVMNTPWLLSQVGRENVMSYEVRLPKLSNTIQAVSCNTSGLYGQKITVGWVSEIHAAVSDEPMQVIASSLGDSEDSWLLIDSTVDAVGGPLHRLEQLQESGEDPTVYVYRKEYRNLDEAVEQSPPWIDRAWLRSREKQTLPVVFKTQHLNQRSAASSNLFALDDIVAAQERLPHPMTKEDLERVAAARKYVVGGGLDRAYFGSIHGDATIWSAIAKIAGDDGGEAHYYVLNQQNVLGSLAAGIKKAIVKDNAAFSLQNVAIEAYNSQDVATWAMEQKLPTEIIHATTTAQVPAFMALYRIVKERRLHFSDKLRDLAREMETFVYELKGDKPKFGSQKHHDDRVYSLAWAVYALREKELAAYEICSIQCNSVSHHSHLCYLLGESELVLPCSQECPAHKKVEAMWLQHRRSRVESDLPLHQFFHSLVNVSGAKIYQAI